MAEIVFNGGDEIRQPFRVMVDGEVADLTGCDVSVIIRKDLGGILTLNADNGGVVIADLTPEGDAPHGIFILTEEQTEQIPGATSRTSARIVVVNAAGVTMSTGRTYFARQA